MRNDLLILMVVVLFASGCATNSSTESPEQVTGNPPEAPVDSNNSNSTSTPSDSNENQTTVTYTDSGFEPATVNIEQGETVVWRSESSRSMWVGSNRHPTHTQYSGSSLSEHCQDGDQNTAAFDQCSSGDTFSFTFEKTGEWSYHNHDYSAHQGTVVVE